jgi:hypothetical protein
MLSVTFFVIFPPNRMLSAKKNTAKAKTFTVFRDFSAPDKIIFPE